MKRLFVKYEDAEGTAWFAHTGEEFDHARFPGKHRRLTQAIKRACAEGKGATPIVAEWHSDGAHQDVSMSEARHPLNCSVSAQILFKAIDAEYQKGSKRTVARETGGASSADQDAQAAVRKLLGLDTGAIATQVTKEVLASMAKDDSLVTAIADALNVPRKVQVTVNDGEPIEIDGIAHPTFERLTTYMASGKVNRIWLTGEAGVGKTYAVEQIAKALKIPLFIVTPVGDKYELMGFKDGSGNYQETELYRWATYDGPCILLIDEIDGSNPNALLSINAALANGLAVFPPGQVKIDARKLVIATANTSGEGATIKYNARFQQDAALRDRFQVFLHWGLHGPTEELIACNCHSGTRAVVAASQRIRKNLLDAGIDKEWGPRRTFALCLAMSCGVSLKEAALDVGLSTLDSNQRERAMKGVRMLETRAQEAARTFVEPTAEVTA